jgi:hypothetical protein
MELTELKPHAAGGIFEISVWISSAYHLFRRLSEQRSPQNE